MADLLRKRKSLYSSTTNSFGTGTSETITPASVTGLPTDTEITLTFDRSVAGKVERIIGTISGGNFVVRTSPSSGRGADGTTEQAHTSPTVEYIPNAKDDNDLIDAILEEHGQTGAHDATKVAMLAGDQTVTGAKTFGAGLLKATSPQVTTGINDSNGNELVKVTAVGSAVNELTISNNATGSGPIISATGGDTNINVKVQGKGTGGVEAVIGAESTADHTATGIKVNLTAGSDVNFGDVCYIASTGKATLVDADAIASSSGLVMAMATIATDASGEFLLLGIARDDTWNWTVGGLIFITVTATTGNTLSQTAPTGTDDVIQIVGVATHQDRMFFSPQLIQVEHT